MPRQIAAFALMSLIWGLTWAAIKIGLTVLPPVLLAALRYLATTALLLPIVGPRTGAFTPDKRWRTVASAILINVGTYPLMFWGMQSVSSGLAGLVNLALIPVLLFGLAALTGEERAGWRHALALGIGCVGLVGLFWTRLTEGSGGSALGLGAIVVGTACYCLGSIVARPLVGQVSPLRLTLAQAALGGVVLLALSFAIEPLSGATWAALASPQAIGSVLFLSLAGTVIGFSVYLMLMREWGTARAGLYAFVSPIVALISGFIMFGEHIGLAEIGGSALMLIAAAIAMRRRKAPASA
ncbi:drug/metabolite transporter (DMT)-like permease [Sphingomonas zeicaulis]|uniref:DMT family transporter n=1 Tax=Sphingomonas zeicaulis TaxID=1632740 RepID=UPI003D1D388F